jgi:hypothetical protein
MIIGQFYQVPAVRVATWHKFVGWIPVIGPMHEDTEFVNFPYQHFHIDWRFVPREIWSKIGNRNYANHHFAWPIQCPDTYGKQVILEGPTLRRMKCKRDAGKFPIERAKWLEPLRQSLGCAKLTNGLCPHRGIPVSAMHREGDILTCPGHGLQWNAVTGLLHRPSPTSSEGQP